jgi:DNA polymerase sigma
MGCGCNKTKEKNTERKTTVSKIRNIVKKVWESTQPEQPFHTVKRINKK